MTITLPLGSPAPRGRVATSAPSGSLVPEDAARRFAKSQPGYQLVDFDQVALPVFRLQIRILTVVRKRVLPITEYALRSIEAGLADRADISGFLGLEQPIVDDALRNLLRTEDIVVSGILNDPTHRLLLTPKGRETLRHLTIEKPEEQIYTVQIDGLTRKRISENTSEEAVRLLKPGEVGKAGLKEIPPYPRYNPKIEEFADSLKAEWNRQTKQTSDLIEVLGVERTDQFFRDDVHLLVFKEIDGPGVVAEFVIGGHLSEEHAEAFRRSDMSNHLSVLPRRLDNPEIEAIDSALPPELQDQRVPAEEADQLRTQTERADERITDLKERLQTTSSASESAVLEEQLRQEQSQRAELQARLDSIPVRMVTVEGHAPYLREALETAQERIMIISPWIRAAVIDEQFMRRLENALRRNVRVYFGYGIGEHDQTPVYNRDQEAIHRLQALSRKYKHFKLVKLGYTHAKVLICDRKFVVVTSFNWLSFKGDPRREYRDERGTYVGIEAFIEGHFQSYIHEFEH